MNEPAIVPQFDEHHVGLVVQGQQVDAIIANGDEPSVRNKHDSVPTGYLPQRLAIGHAVNGRVTIWHRFNEVPMIVRPHDQLRWWGQWCGRAQRSAHKCTKKYQVEVSCTSHTIILGGRKALVHVT